MSALRPYGSDDERIVLDAITSLDKDAARSVFHELISLIVPGVSEVSTRFVLSALDAVEARQMEEPKPNGSRKAATDDHDRATGGSGASAQEDDASAPDPRASAGTGAGEGLSLVPDGITPVVGWRAWEVTYGTALHSLHSEFVWTPGKPTRAKCTVAKRRHAPASCRCPLDAAPAANCTCGIYAARSLDTLPDDYITDRNGFVLGRVALWGRTIVHDDGWRGELAYPQAFFLRPDQEQLRPELVPFGVPILSAADLPGWAERVAVTQVVATRSAATDAEPTVPVICRACGTMTLGYTKGRKFCDECLAINREITAVRSAAKAAAARGLDVGLADEAIAQLEAQRPGPGGHNAAGALTPADAAKGHVT